MKGKYCWHYEHGLGYDILDPEGNAIARVAFLYEARALVSHLNRD